MCRYDRESGEVFILNVIHAARDIEAALSTPQ
jgi:plasmid stabilization system protein ParE